MPQLAWADPDYGDLYALLGILAGVVLLLVIVGVWMAVAHYRSGRPGVGVGNGILMVLAALALLSGDSWVSVIAAGYLGLSAWLLARKQLRSDEPVSEWWAAVGLIGFSWLVSYALVLVPGYMQHRATGGLGAKAAVHLLIFALQLLGWVPLIRQFYARQPVLWASEAVATSLRVAGKATAVSAAVSLLMARTVLVHPEYWREFLLPLLGNELLLGLSVGATMLGVAWWRQRRAAVR
ncbi:hypothetical protein B0919_01110 [Hymenobacter sp. CRA2]|nr:hypothetical protein B0919_01110 [Hymenobacter sp. CRA2]